ncbi:hypothetical protein EYZ11_005675 [Aspergillus tanneri]|uniref:DUF7726 domain-containing protein n=1 Tax=Aspergillus tanneri TaxID=1220188 RepID=A0A4S3JHC4_9EURO|nr:hypothetical protein EYZ11_005675 [Aspergillus tanneri]
MPPKRKSTDTTDPLPEIDSDDERLDEITWNADQIRRLIRSFIESGEMKVGEFQRAINVSSRSYSEFMKHWGPDKGLGSATYGNASRFFKKRELQGIKPPRKKRATKTADPLKYDVSGVHLDGDEDQDVPVYDTCDELRKKIQAHLRDPENTQAQLLRDMAKAAKLEEGRKLSSKSLGDFLMKKGPIAGTQSIIFYAGYVFFEKLRIRDGKSKSKFREEMEEKGCDTGCE